LDIYFVLDTSKYVIHFSFGFYNMPQSVTLLTLLYATFSKVQILRVAERSAVACVLGHTARKYKSQDN
jgi:hypothetical protein